MTYKLILFGSGSEILPGSEPTSAVVPLYKQKRLERNQQKFKKFEDEIITLTDEVMKKAYDISEQSGRPIDHIFTELMSNHVFVRRKSWLNNGDPLLNEDIDRFKWMKEELSEYEYVVITDGPYEERRVPSLLIDIKSSNDWEWTMQFGEFICAYENLRNRRSMIIEKDTDANKNDIWGRQAKLYGMTREQYLLKEHEDYLKEQKWKKLENEIDKRMLNTHNISSQVEV